MSTPSGANGRVGALKVDPAFIAQVIFLRRTCSIKEMALILNCDRKRVLTALGRLTRQGVPINRDPDGPKYRQLTQAQRAEITLLFNNRGGLDFYAICRVMKEAHPLAMFLFLKHEINSRGWWIRGCTRCTEPFPSPRPDIRLCSSRCGTRELDVAYA
ncbi:MAG: hypothetical protein ACE5JD_12040 [Candidatus Methylomirabilia bacterium]